MDIAAESLRLHEQWQGKLNTVPKMDIKTREDLALAYTERSVKLDMGSGGIAAHLSKPLDAAKCFIFAGFRITGARRAKS